MKFNKKYPILCLIFILVIFCTQISFATPAEQDDWIFADNTGSQSQEEYEWVLENNYAKEINYSSKDKDDWYYPEWEYIEHQEPAEIPLRIQIVMYAYEHVGVTPYVHAGRSLISGTDCSGFTNLIYDHFGIALPTGSSVYQSYVGYHVSYEELLPGDIIVYGNGGHVAIYAGDDMVIHCSSPENGTVCWNMWYRSPTAYVRVLD